MKEKYQVPLFTNCLESLGFADVCSANEGFLKIQLHILKQAELFGNIYIFILSKHIF